MYIYKGEKEGQRTSIRLRKIIQAVVYGVLNLYTHRRTSKLLKKVRPFYYFARLGASSRPAGDYFS